MNFASSVQHNPILVGRFYTAGGENEACQRGESTFDQGLSWTILLTSVQKACERAETPDRCSPAVQNACERGGNPRQRGENACQRGGIHV